MRPDGVNGAKQDNTSALERLGKIVQDMSQSDYQLAKNLAGLEEKVTTIKGDINKQVQKFFTNSDKLIENGRVISEISANEAAQLDALRSRLYTIRNILGINTNNLSLEAYNQCGNLKDNVQKLANYLSEAIKGKMPNITIGQEPDVKDNQRPKAQAVDYAKMQDSDLVAEANIIKTDVKLEEYMKTEYERCFIVPSDKEQEHYQMIKSKLGNFLAKYEKELQDLNLPADKEDNYTRISRQIRYYDILADRESERIKQGSINARAGAQSQVGNTFMKNNADAWGKAMATAAHEENARFYELITGNKPPQ